MNASLLRQKPLLWLVLLLAWFVLVVQPVAEKVASGNFFASDGFASGATSESPGLPGLEGIGPENRVGFHETYKYSNSGLGAGAQLAIAIVMAATMGPGAMAAMGGGALGAAGAAVAVGASTNATVSFVNNRGNLGAVWSDTTSSDALKGYAISGVTAGLTAGIYNDLTGTYTDPSTGQISFSDPATRLNTWQGVGQFAAKEGMQNLTSTALSKTLGQGGSFGDALKDSIYNTFAAVGFNAIGDFGSAHGLQSGDAQMVLMHALMGGLAAQARGDSFAAGAVGAGLNEALVADLDKLVSTYSPENREAMLTMASKLTGLIGVVAIDPGADAGKLNTGVWAAQNSTQYNHDLHRDNAASFAKAAMDFCEKSPGQCSANAELVSKQDIIDVLMATAAHGEGAEKLNPEALGLVNRFLNDPDVGPQLNKDLFSYTDSERSRLAVEQKATILLAVVSLGSATRSIGNAVQGFETGAVAGVEAAKAGSESAKGTGSVVDAEKAALDRIAQNPKGVDLAGKQPNSVLQQQSQKRIDDLAVQYNTKSIEPKDFQLNLGGKVLKTDPQVSKGAPVYEGATTSDVMSYFKQLAGVENMPAAKVVPGKGTIYTVQTGSGSKMTLRDFSTSSQQTGASWTIDVRDNAINGGRAVEIKFK